MESDQLIALASELGDVERREREGADRLHGEREGADRLHASIFLPVADVAEGSEEAAERPVARGGAAELASTEHLVNLLANLSDARESFAAAWDDASRESLQRVVRCGWSVMENCQEKGGEHTPLHC